MIDRFGSWCNGLRAANLPARIPDHELPRRERVELAARLHAAGERVSVIADMLGVHPSTVRAYLTAETCDGCGALLPVLLRERRACRLTVPRSDGGSNPPRPTSGG